MADRSRGELQSTRGNADAPDDAPSPRYPIDFARVGALLRQHRALIGRGAVVGTGLAIAYLLLAAPVYTAQTQVLLDPALPSVIQDENNTTAPPAIDSQKVETELAVLRSEEISLAAIKRLNLANDPSFNVRLWSDYLPSWAVSAKDRERAEQRRAQLMLVAFRKDLTVRRVGVSYAIDIYYSAKDAELASRIANAVAEAYVDFQIESRNAAARVGSKWLEGRLTELRGAMNAASRELQKHRASQDYSISAARMTDTEDAAGKTLTLEELESTATTYRRVYENFLGAFMAATQRQSFPISSAQIITRATPPLSQSRSAALILGFAMFAGAIGGGLVSEIKERRRTPGFVADAMSSLDARLRFWRGRTA